MHKNNTYTVLMDIFSGKPGLAGCLQDSQRPVILNTSFLTGYPTNLSYDIPRSFEAEFYGPDAILVTQPTVSKHRSIKIIQ